MTAPVSVVIPVLNAADRIGPCLGALGEALFEGLIHEVILADGGSTDAIQDVADSIGALLVETSPGRGKQLAAGARQARGQWLLFVHADSVLGADWAQAVRDHIRTRPRHAGYFHLRFASTHWMAAPVAAWANLRSRLFGLPYGDQGLLIPRTLYDQTGGYPEIPLMEDVAIVRRLRGHLRMLPCEILTDAVRYETEGWFRRGGRNLLTLIRYFLGTPPEKLARGYSRSR
ncbi:MAG: TIGR04283 family arsenosugar biosynthesis glycosyltransferase [Pseudomonadota bacterium]